MTVIVLQSFHVIPEELKEGLDLVEHHLLKLYILNMGNLLWRQKSVLLQFSGKSGFGNKCEEHQKYASDSDLLGDIYDQREF